jgi:signal transduction histidine kinase/ligand-binding sensor domain-containing protein
MTGKFLGLCDIANGKASVALRILVTTLLFAAFKAWAIDPATHITQYSHTAWRIQDGFFTGAPTAIAQTSDGYLWIGTATGLFRFDGVRFVPWADLTRQRQLASGQISALLGGRDGSLWIGSDYRLFRWKNNTLSQYSNRDELVESIVETKDGSVWLARDRYADQDGPLCRVRQEGLRCFGERDGVPLTGGSSLVEDAAGNLWIGSGTQLLRWKPTSSTVWTLNALRDSQGFNGLEALAAGRNDSLWVGISYPGPGLGLEELQNGRWKTFLSPNLNGSKLTVSRLLLDRDGAIWVGTENQGIYRIINGKVDHFDSADGLSSEKITALFQDQEGTIWVATSKGIDRFRDLPIVTLSTREGLHSDDARSVLSSAGTVWIGNVGSLDAWRNGTITSILTKDGLPGREVTSLLKDPTGGLLVGIDNGMFHFDRQKFVPITQSHETSILTSVISAIDGSVWAVAAGSTTDVLLHVQHDRLLERRPLTPREAVLALAQDLRGRIWLAGDKLSYLDSDNSVLKTVSGFSSRYGYIRNIAIDGDFTWFGATKGLIAVRDGQLKAMTIANGLPCERINTLIFDHHHSLWLYAQCGLIKIDHDELGKWWRDPNLQVKVTTFDALDGFRGGPSSFRPAATESTDGRLWFVNGDVVQRVDPDHMDVNSLPPPVQVEQVISGSKSYLPSNDIQLPQSSRNIEIRYAALSFVIPQRVLFRYKLVGYDTDWQEAGTRRSAFYTNLRPGTYKFQVIACNNSGVWNNQGSTLTFAIPPAWYETTWFRLVAALFLALLCYAFYLLRMRQYAKTMRKRFDERIDERVRIARELHDTLLQSFHGLMFQFQAARNLLPERPKSAMQAFDEAIVATEEAIAEGRDAIRALRPPPAAQRDLPEMLSAVGKEMEGAYGANGQSPSLRVIVEGNPQRLSPTLQNEVYRIGREVIRNAFQHAVASRIEVEIRYDEHQLRLRIRDNGRGIDSKVLEAGGSPGHWGLQGIRERAEGIGSGFELWSELGAGTEVEFRVPAALAYEKQRDGNRFRLFHRGRKNGERS